MGGTVKKQAERSIKMKAKTQVRRFTLTELLVVIGIIAILAGLIVWISTEYRTWRNVSRARIFPAYTNATMVVPVGDKYFIRFVPAKGTADVDIVVPSEITVDGMSFFVTSVSVSEIAPKDHMAFWLALDDNDNIIMRVRVSEYNRAPSGWVIMPKPIPPPIEIR